MARPVIGIVFGAWAAVAVLGATAGAALAQDMLPILPLPDAPPPAKLASATDAAAPGQRAATTLSPAQLDQLVAPIALYPDPLLGQVLMASTYPLEVVEAARWVAVPANRALKGAALTAALQQQHWNPSVMALVPFPHLLAMMSRKVEWTRALGDAFLGQQVAVMTAVQHLRHAAKTAGNLKGGAACHCTVKTGGRFISILPAEAKTVHVPVYTPAVYGAWPEPLYPPFAFPLPVSVVFGPGIPIDYGPAVEVALFGPLWGWDWIDWPHGHIAVDPERYALVSGGRPAFADGVWTHDPAYRGDITRMGPAPAPLRPAIRPAPRTATARAAILRRAAVRRLAAARSARAARIARSYARPAFHPAPYGLRPGQVVPGPGQLAAAPRFDGPFHVAAELDPRFAPPFYRRR